MSDTKVVDVSELSELLNEANTKRAWSSRDISEKAAAKGHRISHSTVAKYLKGVHGAPDERTLRAFCDVLGVSMAKLRKAARLPAYEGPFSLPGNADRLTARQRLAIVEVVNAMLDPGGTQVLERRSGAKTVRKVDRRTKPRRQAPRRRQPGPSAESER